EVGIVGLLRAGVMLQMIAAIGAGLRENRIGAEPLAQEKIGLLVRRQATMRAIMHEDCESQLPRTDDSDRKWIGQQDKRRMRAARDQRNRARDQRPGVHDHRDALPGEALAHSDELVVAEDIAGMHAKRGHDWISPSDVASLPTRRNALPATLLVA